MEAEKECLSGILTSACRAALDELSLQSRFEFDLGEGLREVGGRLGQGEFVRDRPSSGMLSAFYEGPGKWSIALEAMLGHLQDVDEDDIKVLDLGFGGAGPAMALAVASTRWASLFDGPVPSMEVHIVDSSPFVLRFLKNHLWPNVTKALPGANKIKVTFDHNTCALDGETDAQGILVFAGYLFDHVNHRQGFMREFSDALEVKQPNKVWLTGSERSMDGVSELREELRGAGYQTSMVESQRLSGNVRGGVELHDILLRQWKEGGQLLNAPSWNEPDLFCLECTFDGSKQLMLGQANAQLWDMYTAKLRDRKTVKLNDRQRAAATWTGKLRPTCISGPAGSGKSLVLTERLANLVKKPPRETGMKPFDPDFRILVTTFNKELSSELSGWIEEVLGEKAKRKDGGFWFEGSHAMNIHLLHFDVLPTRLGRFGRLGNRLLGGSAAVSIQSAIEKVRKELKLRPLDYSDILNPDYIEEEFDRVFYGMELSSLAEYQTAPRKGRGGTGGGPEQRRIVGMVMDEWMRACHQDRKYTFRMVRRMFLNDLKGERHQPVFTDIFVDEFQDCAPADFSIFYRLIKDSNRLVVAGDLAQSVHLGNTAAMPRDRMDEGEEQRNFRRIFLKGSYRLPLHISLCIQGLSKAIQGRQKESEMMSPYEGAPPGVRLIFVSSDSAVQMAQKIVGIMSTYSSYRMRLEGEGADERAVIMESDKELAKEVSKLRPNSVTSDTILRLKGLEKSMVIWSTRAKNESDDDCLEFVYTILTRSSGLAVIAHFENATPDAYNVVLSTLDHGLLLPWDVQSCEVLRTMKRKKIETDELAF
ncbi:UvrD-helicase domain-containing protein [Flavobacteriales bacterium]|nr:UvrD-helicase domain-containing protein [Flavobacteriales bacterium]